MAESPVPLIIDLGSSMAKVGFGDQNELRACFPTMVKRPRNPGIMVGMDAKDCYVGDEAWAPRGVLREIWPIDYGKSVNWNDTEKLLHHSFYNELRVTPEEHPVLLAEEPDAPVNDREKLCSIMFETFNVLGYFVATRPSLAILHKTKVPTTGVVVQCGATCCRATPVFLGYSLKYAHRVSKFGGDDLTMHLVELLKEKGFDLSTSSGKEIVRDIKEKLAYVVDGDFDEFVLQCEAQGPPEGYGHEYELPDGSKIPVNTERYRVTQALFDPTILPSKRLRIRDERREDSGVVPPRAELLGLAQLVDEAIQATMEDLRPEFYRNIVLSGGSSGFDGLEEALKKRVENLAPPRTEVCVSSSPKRKFAAWYGGALLSQIPEMMRSWLTKEQYDEYGAQIIRRVWF